MLTKSSNAPGISWMPELGVHCGCFLNGHTKLFVRLWPLLAGQDRNVRVVLHETIITSLAERSAGYPHMRQIGRDVVQSESANLSSPRCAHRNALADFVG